MNGKKYSFENFNIYGGNMLAHAVAYETAGHPGEPLTPLYIYGGTGLGKTHLVNAVAEQYGESGKVSYVIITTAERFRTEYIQSIRMQCLDDLYAKYECTDVLIMENFPQFSSCWELQKVFHEIFDVLHEKGKQVILTGDVPPTHLMEFDRSLLSKVTSGYIVQIEPPDFDERLEILEDEMDYIRTQRDLAVDEDDLEEILCILANLESSDIRKLKGMLTSIAGFAEILDEEINLDFAKRILREKK